MPLLRRITVAALLLPVCCLAQREAPLALPADDPVMARLDDLANLHWVKHSPFTIDTAHHNVHGFAPDQVPTWSEDIMQQRVAVLDLNSPFSLVYNRVVQSYIDLYMVRKREMSSRMLGLAELYFPTFEEYLDRHGIPLEMKYLAVVESALNPSARSRAGAVGLWQFMLPTGKIVSEGRQLHRRAPRCVQEHRSRLPLPEVPVPHLWRLGIGPGGIQLRPWQREQGHPARRRREGLLEDATTCHVRRAATCPPSSR